MPSGKMHNNICLLLACLITIYAGVYKKGITVEQLEKFWLGVIICTYILTSDLDTWSNATKVWGPFKIIWRPFRKAGHRKILHNPFWGPFILIGFVWIPLQILGFQLWTETIIGMLIAIECHIICDKVF
jgi:uncharacterized metal-binding protein